MAVAAADFYSYAKATGTPLPKSKQEEAQLAPAVNNWKKSRLKAPERERDSGDLGNVLGGGAIAAGLAGAALYGYRRGWGDSPAPRKPAPTGDLPSEIPTNLYKGDERGIKLGKKPIEDTTTTYRSAVTDIPDQPQVKTEFQNQAASDRDWDLAYIKGREDGLSDADAVLNAKRTVGQPIRKDYSPGPETEHRQYLSTLKTSSPIKNPRSYIESTGAVEPTVQVTNVDTPKDLLALPAASTYKDTTSPEQLYIQQKLAELQTGPKALESLGDEQIDVIRGTVANAKLYPQTTSEVRRQEARMRTNDKIAQEGIDELLGREFVDDTLVAQQKTIASELADQSLESANSGYQQMDDKLDRSVQRDTDSIAVGNQAVELEKTQQALLQQAKQYDYQAGPMPPTIKPEDVTEAADGINYFNPWAADHEEIIREQAVDFASGKVPGSTPYKDRDPVSGYLYTDIQDKLLQDAYDRKYSTIIPLDEPGNPNTSIVSRKNTLTQSDIDKINQVGMTGTRIAGPSNVQSIRNNQTLTRQGPVPEVEVPEQTFLKTQLDQRLDKLQQETTELQALSENLERAGQLMTGGTRAVNNPRSTTFDNARAAAMVARAGIKPRITNQYYQKNISLPKTMRQAVDTGSRDPGRIIDTEPKGGGGRKVTAYNPDYQQLSTIGPYGIERANYPRADITKRPTEMPISPRTGKPTQSWSTRPSSSPEIAREGIKVSEDLRAIYNSGRPDAQQQADAYIEALRKRMGN
jgi:hypothetical protein